MIQVLEHIARTIDAWALGVPEREDTIVLRLTQQMHLLRAPYGGGGQIFIHPRLETDVVRRQRIAGLPECLIQPAQRRAAIARHKARRVEPSSAITQALHHHQADQRVDTAQEHAPRVRCEFVLCRDELHANLAKGGAGIKMRRERGPAPPRSGHRNSVGWKTKSAWRLTSRSGRRSTTARRQSRSTRPCHRASRGPAARHRPAPAECWKRQCCRYPPDSRRSVRAQCPS